MSFVEELEMESYTTESLDDIVHDAASKIASALNNQAGSDEDDDLTHDRASSLASKACNEGLQGQVTFLIKVCGWSEKDIVAALQQGADR